MASTFPRAPESCTKQMIKFIHISAPSGKSRVMRALEQRLDKYGTSLLTAVGEMGDLNHICSPLCPLQAARSHDDMSTILCKGLGAVPAHSTAAASDQEYLQDSCVLNNRSLDNECVSCMSITEGTCA